LRNVLLPSSGSKRQTTIKKQEESRSRRFEGLLNYFLPSQRLSRFGDEAGFQIYENSQTILVKVNNSEYFSVTVNSKDM
jgi:hypothetical protein